MFGTLQRLLTSTLRRQLMTGLVLTVVVLMAAFTWDSTRRQQQAAVELQSMQATGLARSVALTGTAWLAARDVSGLQELVQSLSNYPDLSYAMVLDTTGQVLAHTEPARRGQYMTDLPVDMQALQQQRGPLLVDVFSPVRLEGRQIGWVRLGLKGASLDERLAKMARSGLVYLLVAVGLATAIAAVITRFLTMRLAEVSHVANAVRHGRTDLRVPVRGNDEFTALSRQFNTMLDAQVQRDLALSDSEAFKNTILNSVAAEIAVIDQQGTIVAVNQQWRRFSLDNASLANQRAPHTDVGTNYLEMCFTGNSHTNLGTELVRDGIQSVLNGNAPQFSLDYPCHSPTQQRWFTMNVQPLGAHGQTGAVITHTDISAVKLAERYEHFRGRMLELMAGQTDLPNLLYAMACGVEQLHPDMQCSILLMDASGRHMDEVIAPSLPDYYCQFLRDTEIGPNLGFSATAAFTGQRVVVEDIATDPSWAENKAIALRAGLRACWSQPVVSTDGQVLGAFTIYLRQARAPSAQDMALVEQTARLASIATESKQTHAQLRASEVMFRTLFETLPTGVLYESADGRITSANPAAQRILGLTLDQLQGLTSTDPRWRAVHEDGSDFAIEDHPISQAIKTGQPVRNVMMGVLVPNRGDVWLLVSAMPLFKDGKLEQAYGVFEDVTEHYTMEQKVRQMAFYDPLTELPNRRLLDERLGQAITASRRSACFGAMMFLDLDNFKPLNDRHGHELGDLLLIEVARRLKHCVREADTVARIGGDEFVVMLAELHMEQTQSMELARAVAEKVRETIAQPYQLSRVRAGGDALTVEHHCTASIGITLFSYRDTQHQHIIKRADGAMYQAKHEGRNRVHFDEQA